MYTINVHKQKIQKKVSYKSDTVLLYTVITVDYVHVFVFV